MRPLWKVAFRVTNHLANLTGNGERLMRLSSNCADRAGMDVVLNDGTVIERSAADVGTIPPGLIDDGGAR